MATAGGREKGWERRRLEGHRRCKQNIWRVVLLTNSEENKSLELHIISIQYNNCKQSHLKDKYAQNPPFLWAQAIKSYELASLISSEGRERSLLRHTVHIMQIAALPSNQLLHRMPSLLLS